MSGPWNHRVFNRNRKERGAKGERGKNRTDNGKGVAIPGKERGEVGGGSVSVVPADSVQHVHAVGHKLVRRHLFRVRGRD